jgi:hypothetical protein
VVRSAARRLLLIMIALAALAPAAPAAAHGPDGTAALITHRDTRAELAQVDVAATAAAAAAPSALPSTWCGDARTTDDTANAALPASSPRFKLVYAHPADRPDRFAGWSHALQANVALVQRFLAAQSGGRKALRFDMGTRCGPQFVDIQVVHLSGPRDAYADNFPAIVGEVESRLGPAAGPRNVVVLADTLNGSTNDYGLGENVLGPSGDRPGAGNVHNRGGFASVLFTRDGQPEPGADPRGWWPEGLLHEITHNLGGVQWSAPHTTQPAGFQHTRYGHCWQGADVMCYVEDAGAAHPMQWDCPRVGGAIPQAYDCGRDDYFNPDPPAGSYLATHWNVYDNAFLGPCEQLAPACGGGMEGLVPTPPVAAAAPAVAGSPRRGLTVAAAAGDWRNGPLSYAYRWQRERRGVWSDIPGATRSSYVPSRTDTGRRLRVQVVATNPDGSASAASPPSARVADGMVGSAKKATKRCKRAAKRGKKGRARARRSAARCRGRRTSKRASPSRTTPARRSAARARRAARPGRGRSRGPRPGGGRSRSPR